MSHSGANRADGLALVWRLLAVVATVASGVAAAEGKFDASQVEAGMLDPALVEAGWVLLTKRNVAPTVFTAAGEQAIEVEVRQSNALIYRELADTVLTEQTRLEWEWQLSELGGGTGSGKDPDWPIAVYVAFDVDQKYVGWWRRLMNRLTFSAAGLPASGKILTYIWNPAETAGLMYPNPYIPAVGSIHVLRGKAAEPGRWYTEQRSLAADFEAAFGHPAKAVLFVALSADGEDSQRSTRAAVRNLVTVRP